MLYSRYARAGEAEIFRTGYLRALSAALKAARELRILQHAISGLIDSVLGAGALCSRWPSAPESSSWSQQATTLKCACGTSPRRPALQHSRSASAVLPVTSLNKSRQMRRCALHMFVYHYFMMGLDNLRSGLCSVHLMGFSMRSHMAAFRTYCIHRAVLFPDLYSSANLPIHTPLAAQSWISARSDTEYLLCTSAQTAVYAWPHILAGI